MPDNKRDVLARVAAGELAPEEALALLEQDDAAAGPAAATGGVVRVVVEADLGAVTIAADSSVRDAVAIGGHTIRRTGDEVRIEGAHGRSIVGDGRLLPRLGRKHALRVRMNPDLDLEVRLGAGSVHLEGQRSSVKIVVDLGTATLEHVTGPFDVRVESGTVSASATAREGESRISCDLGSVNVRLHRKSDVTVTAATDAGRITLPGQKGHRPSIVFGANAEAVVGAGTGKLDLHTGAGSIAVSVDK